MSIKGVLKAQIALRGLLIEWVNVRGFTEENPDESKVIFPTISVLINASKLQLTVGIT